MKVKLFSIVVLLCVTTHTLISCDVERDTDDPVSKTELDYTLKGEGQITVTDDNGNIQYTRKLSDAGYRESLDFGRNLEVTLWLRATFKNEGSGYDTSFLVNSNRISRISLNHTFEGLKLKLGVIPKYPAEVVINHISKDKDGFYDWSDERGYFDGEVSIISFEGNRYITVAFRNCKCNVNGKTRYRFSGTIKFPLRKWEFFR